MKAVLLPLVLALACDQPSVDAKSTPAAEEPVLCGLHQAQSNAAMLALAKCTTKASALAAESKTDAGAANTDPPPCDDERADLVAANEKFIACIDNQSGGDSDVALAVRKMKVFADDMCACKDKACADQVTNELVRFGEDMSKKHEGKPEPKIGEAQKKQMEESMTRLTECTMKAMGG